MCKGAEKLGQLASLMSDYMYFSVTLPLKMTVKPRYWSQIPSVSIMQVLFSAGSTVEPMLRLPILRMTCLHGPLFTLVNIVFMDKLLFTIFTFLASVRLWYIEDVEI